MEKIRVDKWLWAIRIYKTRTAATKACDSGKVKRSDEKLKASSKISVGDVLSIRIMHITKTLKVTKLIAKRVGAAIAITCYEDITPPEVLEQKKLASAFYMQHARRDRGTGRPTKKERREIDKLNDFLDE